MLPARITRLKEEATAKGAGGLVGRLHEQAVHGPVEAQLLAEGGGGVDRAFEVELDVETGGELAVDDAGELLLAEVLGLETLFTRGLPAAQNLTNRKSPSP